MFKEVDTDGSGVIDADEMGAAMAKLGCEMPSDVLQNVMLEIDSTGDGGIDAEEFCTFIAKVIRGELPDAMMVQAEMGGPRKTEGARRAFVRI